MLTYLKLSNLGCGLLLNFGRQDLMKNIERFENTSVLQSLGMEMDLG
jgi:hypothetical protein